MAAAAVVLRHRRSGRLRVALGGDADERLVARVREGDDAAFEAIYDRYHNGLLAFCRHMLGSREEAEDALQHSFVSAYRALRSSSEDIALRPWLYAIARNRCLSVLRARREVVDVAQLQPTGPEFDGLATQIQRRSELRDLVEDMHELPEDQRAALVLFELGDHSHAEIAQVLGVRKDKVKALVFQAREGLVRARYARETPCEEIREQLAVLTGKVSRRSALHRHLDHCPGCRLFAAEVRHQRNALAAILPVVPSLGLKTAVLGSALGGGGVAAVGAGAGGAALAVGAGTGATTAGGGTALCGASAGAAAGVGVGATAAGTGAVSAGSIASGIAVVGAGASSVHSGLAGLGGKAAVAKILTVVAVSGSGSQAPSQDPVPARPAPAVVEEVVVPPAAGGVPGVVAPTLAPPAATQPPMVTATPAPAEPAPTPPPAPVVPVPVASAPVAEPTPDPAPPTVEATAAPTSAVAIVEPLVEPAPSVPTETSMTVAPSEPATATATPELASPAPTPTLAEPGTVESTTDSTLGEPAPVIEPTPVEPTIG